MPEISEMDRLRQVFSELARRKIRGINLYQPHKEQVDFHQSPARIRIVVGSNRSGKTLVAAVEVARAATGNDPFKKFPRENGRIFCVGKNLDHVGQVMWRKLARAESFKMIRDEVTKEWRSWQPWNAYDISFPEKVKWAPPLIPPSLIRTIAWENKAKSIPKLVVLQNGWEIAFFSGEGKPPAGVDLDMVWL